MTTETILTDEQIGDLYQDWYCLFKDDPGSASLCIRAIEQAVLQSPEVRSWKRDAERYRYLRQAGVDYSTDLDVFDAEGNCLNEEELDGAVDAAMERRP